jgi:nicotinate-nucleotide adenylyltransferase
MKLGLFGGTFDPPHLGHLILAAEAYHQLGLSRLLWLLTPIPPHKPGRPLSSVEQRIALVQAAIDGDPAFEFSRIDIDRPSPYYALDTVRLLRAQQPSAEVIYLMGGDSLHDLPTWRHPQEFILACDALGVMRRPGYQVDLSALEAALPGITEKVRFVDTPLLDISSSDIRNRISHDQPYRYFLPPAVWKLIQEQEMYVDHRPDDPSKD